VNKISQVVNCASREVPNFFANQNVEYLNIAWEESDHQVLFDQQGQTLAAIAAFVNKAQAKGESVLVHSLRGQSRASCAVCAYLMLRYAPLTQLQVGLLQNTRVPRLPAPRP
jgi:protein-tyrosine phosphatase